MLLGNFFDIQLLTIGDVIEAQQKCSAIAALNCNHPIYEGHFQGNPVVPGVCQVQMVAEIVEIIVNHPIKLTTSDNIKFLSMINPMVNPLLTFEIVIRHNPDQCFSVTASVQTGAILFFKFKGKFESVEKCQGN